MDAMQIITQGMVKENRPQFEIGDTVRVSVRIKEGERERIQAFEGTVIAKKHGGIAETFTVRRTSYGVGVERVFPVNSPFVEKVEVVRHGKVRRAKLFYLRSRTGKAAKVKEQIRRSKDTKKGAMDIAPFFVICYNKIHQIYSLSRGREHILEETRFQRNVDILDWYDALVFALAVLVLVFAFCARIVVVSGSSMNNTLTGGDRLLVQSTFYTPQRGDVVVVDSYINYGKPLVKRVIAKGGDTVDIDVEQGLVYVNGEALDEPYVPEGTLSTGHVEFPLTVPEGTLFLMGDNRQHSTDSRSSDVGFIDERDILGKVVLRIYPFNKIGLIE